MRCPIAGRGVLAARALSLRCRCAARALSLLAARAVAALLCCAVLSSILLTRVRYAPHYLTEILAVQSLRGWLWMGGYLSFSFTAQAR